MNHLVNWKPSWPHAVWIGISLGSIATISQAQKADFFSVLTQSASFASKGAHLPTVDATGSTIEAFEDGLQLDSFITVAGNLSDDKPSEVGSERFAAHVEFDVPSAPEIPLETPCDEVLTERLAFFAYNEAQKLLAEGVRSSEVPFLDCFLTGKIRSEEPSEALSMLWTTSFNREVLLGYLGLQFERTIARTIEQAHDRGGYLAWPGAYLGETALLAFQRTRDPRLLQLYIGYFDRVVQLSDPRLGIRDEYHGRIMNSWGYMMQNGVLGEGDQRNWVAHVTHFGRILTPALGFANEILSDPDLALEHGNWAFDVVRFFETGWQQFEMDRRLVGDGSHSWYWRPIDDEFEPINHVTSLGRALIHAHAITQDPVLKHRIDEILMVFEDAVTVHKDGSVAWPYSPTFQTITTMQSGVDAEYSEYTWKASITLPFIREAINAGYILSSGLEESIRNQLVNYTLADGVLKRNLHPFRSLPVAVNELDRFRAVLGGLHMSFPDDIEIGELTKQMLVLNHELFPRGWFTHPGSSRSYALFLD